MIQWMVFTAEIRRKASASQEPLRVRLPSPCLMRGKDWRLLTDSLANENSSAWFFGGGTWKGTHATSTFQRDSFALLSHSQEEYGQGLAKTGNQSHGIPSSLSGNGCWATSMGRIACGE
eukprot:s857_g15.t1